MHRGQELAGILPLSGLPDGVSVAPGRIEERFEALVEGGDQAGGGGAVRA